MPMTPRIDIPLGTKLSDIEDRPKWLDSKLSDFDLKVGDLVTYNAYSYSTNMTIYRVTKDFPPNGEVVASEITTRSWRGAQKRLVRAWTLPGRRARVPDIRIRGCVEVTPEFTFFQGPWPLRKRFVRYGSVKYTLKKLDILELAKNFSAFQDFIRAESQRLGS